MADKVSFEYCGKVLYTYVWSDGMPYACWIETMSMALAKKYKIDYHDIVIRIKKVGEDNEQR